MAALIAGAAAGAIHVLMQTSSHFADPVRILTRGGSIRLNLFSWAAGSTCRYRTADDLFDARDLCRTCTGTSRKQVSPRSSHVQLARPADQVLPDPCRSNASGDWQQCDLVRASSIKRRRHQILRLPSQTPVSPFRAGRCAQYLLYAVISSGIASLVFGLVPSSRRASTRRTLTTGLFPLTGLRHLRLIIALALKSTVFPRLCP
jgi:hypothetical protein